MPLKNKHNIALLIAIDLILLSLGLFLWLCWTAAASEQGAIGLVIYAPLVFAFIVGAFFLARYASKAIPLGKFPKRAAILLAAFYLTFYVSPFIGLGAVPDTVIGGVAKTFKTITGKSPMEWSKAR